MKSNKGWEEELLELWENYSNKKEDDDGDPIVDFDDLIPYVKEIITKNFISKEQHEKEIIKLNSKWHKEYNKLKEENLPRIRSLAMNKEQIKEVQMKDIEILEELLKGNSLDDIELERAKKLIIELLRKVV